MISCTRRETSLERRSSSGIYFCFMVLQVFVEALEEFAELAVRFEIIVVIIHPGENNASDVLAQGEVSVLIEDMK
jgi:hypothetical protein